MAQHTGESTPRRADETTPPAPDADSAQPNATDATDSQAADATEPDSPKRTSLRWRISRQLTIWTIFVPLVAMLAGALFSASSSAARGTDLRSAASDIPDLIRSETRRGEIRAAEVSRLQSEVDQLTQVRRSGNEIIDGIIERADSLAQEAGAAPVVGPGLVVSMTDSPLRGDQIPDGLKNDDLVVHQQDVQGVVNALWRGGAEAMMIMDQRVISTSAVRCVGNTLILQGRVYSPPFVITAIGDQERLQRALDNDRSVQIFKEYVDAAGLGFTVERRNEIEMPAYSGSVRLQYATPIRR